MSPRPQITTRRRRAFETCGVHFVRILPVRAPCSEGRCFPNRPLVTGAANVPEEPRPTKPIESHQSALHGATYHLWCDLLKGLSMKVDGACLCGSVTYEAEIDPDRVAICHCLDCQTNSGSAYGVVASVTDGRFQLLTGTLQVYEKTAESGRVRQLSFCPICGTRIHACSQGDPSAFFGLRVGTIRQRKQLKPKVQVWCGSALPWVFDLSGIVRRETQS